MTCLQSHMLNAQTFKVFMRLSRHGGTSMGSQGYHKLMDGFGVHNSIHRISLWTQPSAALIPWEDTPL